MLSTSMKDSSPSLSSKKGREFIYLSSLGIQRAHFKEFKLICLELNISTDESNQKQ